MTYSPQAQVIGSARQSIITRVREIAAEYREGTGATACMAEIMAALRDYDRRRPQVQERKAG